MRPKILHLIQQLGLGGAERQLYYLLKSLHRNYEFRVISWSQESVDFVQPIRELGVPVQILVKERSILSRFSFFMRLAQEIREIRPAIIQTWLDSADFWGFLAKYVIFFRGATICSVRNTDSDMGWMRKMLTLSVGRGADLIIANTFAAKRQLLGLRLPISKIRVIHNGIDPQHFNSRDAREEVRNELGIEPWKVVIGTVGRITPQKNQTMFVDIARHLAAQSPIVHFIIVGDGILRSELERKIYEAGLSDRFTLTGQRKDISRLLSAFDIFILTSSWEGLPNVIMEAMCARLPVVATTVGGVPELIEDGKNGVLVPPGDVLASAAALEGLLETPNERIRLGNEARRTIETSFHIQQMVDKTAKIYDALVTAKF